MGAHNADVDITPLWKKAKTKFDESPRKKDSKFLKHTQNTSRVMRYLGRMKENPALKSTGCGPLLDRLDLIAEIGDIAMKGAPEIVGLVWTGFRFIFKVSALSNQNHAMCSSY